MAQKTTLTDADGNVIKDDNALDIGGSSVDLICEQLHQIVEQLKITNSLLEEIGR